MRLYYFTGSQFALDNIANRRLKVSFADQVNDIFELNPFDFGEEKDVARAARLQWQRSIRNHAKTQGFISFSKSWNSPAMWGHYAENHLGVCYGFDIPSGPNTTLVEMKYPDKLKKFDHAALSDRNVLTEMINYAQRHKSQVWEYEQEWRTDVSLNKDEQEAKARGASIFYLPFSEKLKLKKIIIGTRSKITSTQINNALGPMSGCVEIVTARASFREYKIVEQKLSRLKK